MKYVTVIILGIIFLSAYSPDILGTRTVFIHGYVYDAADSAVIDSANVDGQHWFTSSTFHQTTNSSGYYCEADTTLPRGSWQVTASHPGYYPQIKNVSLPTQTYINFYLTPR